MAKIKNWSRRQDLEGLEGKKDDIVPQSKTIRAWENDNNNSIVMLNHFKDSYMFSVNSDIIWEEAQLNREEAMKKATKWLKNHPYDSDEIPNDDIELKEKLIEVGKTVEPSNEGLANDLSKNEVQTIVATVDFFDRGDEKIAARQTYSDLTEPTKYRVWDWLGMMMDTGFQQYSEEDRMRLKWLFDKLAEIYIQEKSVDGFMNQLRMRDLQVEMPSEYRATR